MQQAIKARASDFKIGWRKFQKINKKNKKFWQKQNLLKQKFLKRLFINK